MKKAKERWPREFNKCIMKLKCIFCELYLWYTDKHICTCAHVGNVHVCGGQKSMSDIVPQEPGLFSQGGCPRAPEACLCLPLQRTSKLSFRVDAGPTLWPSCVHGQHCTDLNPLSSPHEMGLNTRVWQHHLYPALDGSVTNRTVFLCRAEEGFNCFIQSHTFWQNPNLNIL